MVGSPGDGLMEDLLLFGSFGRKSAFGRFAGGISGRSQTDVTAPAFFHRGTNSRSGLLRATHTHTHTLSQGRAVSTLPENGVKGGWRKKERGVEYWRLFDCTLFIQPRCRWREGAQRAGSRPWHNQSDGVCIFHIPPTAPRSLLAYILNGCGMNAQAYLYIEIWRKRHSCRSKQQRLDVRSRGC